MSVNQITIISSQTAQLLIPKLANTNSLCYYLSDDYRYFMVLKHKFKDRIEIRSLSGLFDETFQETKGAILEAIAMINNRYNSLHWWGGLLASRNLASTPLIRNITYLFCVKRIISDSGKEFIFIVDSKALSDCVRSAAKELGYKVVRYKSRMIEYADAIRLLLTNMARILYFFWQSFQSRKAAFKILKPLPAFKTSVNKRIVIRSWITKGTLDKSGKFKDRNFGYLPEWLHSKDYDVWILPMFFNLSMSLKDMYYLMKSQKQLFLIPDHYLKLTDYLEVLYNSYRIFRTKMDNVEIRRTDIAPLLNEALKEEGFSPSLLILNLCYPMLKRLKEKQFEIDGFYYPFENNSPEKQFILGCRKFFPESKIVGFQHTTFFPNQLSHHLVPDEKYYHPLPDKIVCSGPIYVKLHNEAGFPSDILVAGPNLRFESVYVEKAEVKNNDGNKNKILLLPLTFSYDLAFELFVKTREALKDILDYQVHVRNHPLLSKKTLQKFLNQIGMNNYKFADDGIIQDWLVKSYAVISTGASITILEAVSMGTPVIRVIPDNTFFYDPFTWPDYPLKPVNSSSEIRKQLGLIDEIQDKDKETFRNIAREILLEYFTKPNEENLKVFL